MTLEKDFGLELGDEWLPIRQDARPLLAALGDHCELYAAPSFLFEGEDKEFACEGVAILTNPDGGQDIWYLASLTSDHYQSARGIRIGDSQKELIAA